MYIDGLAELLEHYGIVDKLFADYDQIWHAASLQSPGGHFCRETARRPSSVDIVERVT